jgi:hypothetical protein
MNSKRAKALRKVARNAAKFSGAENNVVVAKVAYVEDEAKRKYAWEPIFDDKGELEMEEDGYTPKYKQVLVSRGPTILHPSCERSVYLEMKKSFRPR